MTFHLILYILTFSPKFQANHEEDVKQRTAAEGIQAVSVAKPELVSEDAKGESEMRGTSEKPETVVIRKLVSWADLLGRPLDSIVFLSYLNKTCCGLWRTALHLCCIIVFSDTIKQSVTELDIFQPKSTTSSESGGSGKSRVSGKLPKKSKDKSMLNNFKDFLHSKLKKHERKAGDDVFHGFSDEEIRSASANDSSSERSSIISSLSREEKDERKKRKSEAATAARASLGMSGDSSNVPLLHQSLIVEGKRPKKPSAKIQELTQVKYLLGIKPETNFNCFRTARLEANRLTVSQKRKQSHGRKQMD